MVVGGRRGAIEAGLVVFGEPVGEQLLDGVGLNDGAGEDMCADFAGFLEEEDTEVFIASGGGELLKTNRGGETGGT